ncbi:amino acid adenylation domain-containing protein [uncultured Jatrophihabitans sp.]|uniref:non-ribosomal peptide synthetase n=1 Tax=uncultured Jatrophihabitans sp. TaxID=1610747 RepID=UPI0035CAFB6D
MGGNVIGSREATGPSATRADDSTERRSATDERNAALAVALKQRLTARAKQQDEIPTRDPRIPRRLSFQQERLFALDQIVDVLRAYNQSQAFRIRGPLDVPALELAVLDLQRQHEILRTRVRLAGGDIEVTPVEPIPLQRIELAPETLVDERLRREWVTREVQQPIELATNGPLRITLASAAPEDHLIVISLHHIACDDVSKRLLFDDLGQFYRARVNGHEPSLRPAALQFSDYAHWHRERFAGHSGSSDVSWWSDYLAGAPAATTLPLDRPRPAVATDRGAKFRSQLDAATVSAIEDLGRHHGATPYMVLVAAFSWVLELFGGDGDVVLGTPVSGRDRAELRSIIGLFLNTLPLRVSTTGDVSLGDLVERVRTSVVGVLGHQHVPFDVILDAVQPERTASHAPIFQVMITMRSESATQPRFGDSVVEPVGYDGGWAKFDLGLTCVAGEGGSLDVLWQYSTDIFERATIERLAACLSSVLDIGCRRPDVALRELSASADPAIEAWNDTRVDDVPDVPVHQLIEAQVDRTPNAVAVLDEATALTFHELDARANQLAHELIARNVGVGDVVAVAMQRSVHAEVAVLGILKSGAVYLPIDPKYPAARQEFLLRDSSAALVLTDRSCAGSVPLGTPRLLVDGDPDPVAARPTDRPRVAVRTDDLAYLLYTSGSTGQPKGVLCEHRGLVNRLIWMAAEYSVGPDDVVLQKTPLTFDVSVWELLLAPMTGARLVMARPDAHGDPAYLREVIDARGVTMVHFVPSMLAAFLLTTPTGSCPSVRLILSSGEALPLETARTCLRELPHSELHNLYGPTEASIDVSATRCAPGDERITIGRPIANMRIHVLDQQQRPVPVGAAGELYLAGVGVARGYLNRPDLTAERFLTEPSTGERMYRTGDRGRWLSDGSIEYLGRLDDQVKLRGFRIELGEIESALAALDGVAAAICDLRGTTVDEQRLIGYVVPADPSAPPEAGELRRQLGRLLPAYEVPSAIGVIAAVPLSANGKADRRQLPDVGVVGSAIAVQPRDAIEVEVAAVWRQVLGVDDALSVLDNFFDVGGHSLSALRLFAMLEKTLHVKIPLSMMIQGVTIADMADYVRRARAGDNHATNLLVPMRTSGDLPPLFAMPGLRGDVLVYRQMLAELDPRRPVYGVQCRGVDGRSTPRTTMKDIAADCVSAIRSAQPSGPYYVFGYCFSGIVAYEVGRQLRAAGEQVALVGIIDATPPRGALPSTANGRWQHRLRLVKGGRSLFDLVGMFVLRRVRWRLAVAYSKLGLPIPPKYVDFYAANRKAQLSFVPEAADLHVTLIRKARADTTLVPQDRWATLAARGMDVIVLDAEGADHHKIIQSRFAGQVAQAVNIAAQAAASRSGARAVPGSGDE